MNALQALSILVFFTGLQLLLIDLKFDSPFDSDSVEQDGLTFATKVSEVLAFSRMPSVKVWMRGVSGLNAFTTGDLQDSDYESDDGPLGAGNPEEYDYYYSTTENSENGDDSSGTSTDDGSSSETSDNDHESCGTSEGDDISLESSEVDGDDDE